jgi:hypothetical protein
MKIYYYDSDAPFLEKSYVKLLCRNNPHETRMITSFNDVSESDEVYVTSFYKPVRKHRHVNTCVLDSESIEYVNHKIHKVSPQGILYVINSNERNLEVSSIDTVCVLDDSSLMRNYARLLGGKYMCNICVSSGTLSLDTFLSYASIHESVSFYGNEDANYEKVFKKMFDCNFNFL